MSKRSRRYFRDRLRHNAAKQGIYLGPSKEEASRLRRLLRKVLARPTQRKGRI